MAHINRICVVETLFRRSTAANRWLEFLVSASRRFSLRIIVLAFSVIIGPDTADAIAEPSTPLPPLRLNSSEISSPFAANVSRGEAGTGAVAGLPSVAVQRLAAKMEDLTGRDPSWIMGRIGLLITVFIGLVWVQRFFGVQASSRLPTDAVEMCGKVRLDAKQTLYLVRVGSRLLVILETPHGVQRLAEITDPDEVQRLLDPKAKPNSKSDFAAKSPRTKRVASTASELLAQLRDHEGAWE